MTTLDGLQRKSSEGDSRRPTSFRFNLIKANGICTATSNQIWEHFGEWLNKTTQGLVQSGFICVALWDRSTPTPLQVGLQQRRRLDGIMSSPQSSAAAAATCLHYNSTFTAYHQFTAVFNKPFISSCWIREEWRSPPASQTDKEHFLNEPPQCDSSNKILNLCWWPSVTSEKVSWAPSIEQVKVLSKCTCRNQLHSIKGCPV